MIPRAIVVCRCEEHGYDVVAGDTIEPGVVVATVRDREEANRVCVLLAMSLRVRALPLGEP